MDNRNCFEGHTGKFIALIVVSGLVVFFLRSIYTIPPELGEGVRKKWRTAIVLSEQHDLGAVYEKHHHSARWGSILPTVFLNKLVGISLFNYYIVPLTLYCILFCMLGWIAYRTMGSGMATVFAIVMFYEPTFFRASSQLQPYVFGATYLVISIWAIDKFLCCRRYRYIFIASIFAFLTYAAKETYIFFYPGLFALLFVRKEFRFAVLFAGLLFVWLIMETWVFNLISGHTVLGRIELLNQGKHFGSIDRKYEDGVTILEFLFVRWGRLGLINQILCGVAFIYSFYLICSNRIASMGNASLAIFLCAISYCLLVTVIPLKLNPLTPLQPLLPKYLIVVMPLIVYCGIFAIYGLISQFSGRAKKLITGALVSSACLFMLYSLAMESPFKYEKRVSEYPEKLSFVWRYNQVFEQFESGYGICSERRSLRLSTTTLLRLYRYPPYSNDDIETSSMRTSTGNKVYVVHHKNYTTDGLSGYLSARTLIPVTSLDECDSIGG